MDMIIDFPGGMRVDAHFGPFTIPTDQPPVASAPTPFATFLASIGTCAGIYVLGFCRQRGISTEGVRLVQSLRVNPFTGLVSHVNLDIQVPPDFPEKYKAAVIRAADQCAVKKHFEYPPQITVQTTTVEMALQAGD
ncbi:MAG: OsmC family protein [Ardenticatenaceae bacterium]|nr:OsmC family protein [Anaerolineales bacterium]MCB8920721.1 OsmC family protein [Ardenticatenaceae bacterium]MCB8989680.1 OsmC family protein [Ardenticatenaceae bacterium]MCB9002861.1 OsmC family protein [Ardenticatenaceae bacterium]